MVWYTAVNTAGDGGDAVANRKFSDSKMKHQNHSRQSLVAPWQF